MLKQDQDQLNAGNDGLGDDDNDEDEYALWLE